MTVIALITALTLLAALAVVQVLAAFGVPLGRLVWGGRSRVLPPRLRTASAISVLLYAAMAMVLLSRAGAIPGSDSTFTHVATWVLCGFFALGALPNAVSRSRPERYTMTPASVALALATLIIALTH